jgi:hypothetical protein
VPHAQGEKKKEGAARLPLLATETRKGTPPLCRCAKEKKDEGCRCAEVGRVEKITARLPLRKEREKNTACRYAEREERKNRERRQAAAPAGQTRARNLPYEKIIESDPALWGVESDATSLVLPVESTLRENYSSACDAVSLAAPHLNY